MPLSVEQIPCKFGPHYTSSHETVGDKPLVLTRMPSKFPSSLSHNLHSVPRKVQSILHALYQPERSAINIVRDSGGQWRLVATLSKMEEKLIHFLFLKTVGPIALVG